MKSLSRQRGQLLIIYLSTLFVGGSSLALGILSTGKPMDDLVEAVETMVPAGDRQARTLQLLDQWGEEGEARQSIYREQRERLLELLQDHAASRAQFLAEIDRLLETDSSTATQLLDMQYQLRENLTESEWQQVMSQ